MKLLDKNSLMSTITSDFLNNSDAHIQASRERN